MKKTKHLCYLGVVLTSSLIFFDGLTEPAPSFVSALQQPTSSSSRTSDSIISIAKILRRNNKRSNGPLYFVPSSRSHHAYPQRVNEDDSMRPLLNSPLFLRVSKQATRRKRGSDGGCPTELYTTNVGKRKGRRSTTRREMVVTTPDSIIEQASTQNLLDDLIDESVRTSSRRPIMLQFNPSGGYIWKRWKGTVFSETWRSCVRNMAISVVILFLLHTMPDIRKPIDGFSVLWGQLLSVTTFTLTFFLNQSYQLWRKCYELSRRLQGRLNDLGMTLAAHASRQIPEQKDQPSTYTGASQQLLTLVGRYIRLFNLLTYASFTRSHRPILTPRGMRRLVERGLLTPEERQVLVDAEIPATQRHNSVVMWIMRAFVEGRHQGHFNGGDGFEQQFLEKCHVIRSQYGAIADELQGRMPMAYAHIVQVLVDVILWLYPVMAFSSRMSPFIAVLGSGLLTMSYRGLFDLAKQFLDPYDNENYGRGEDPLCVDTLIAETNSGSVRWMYAFEQMPFSSERIKDGDMERYLLPLRGYSVEDLNRIEEERLKKEKAEEERLQALEEENEGFPNGEKLESEQAEVYTVARNVTDVPANQTASISSFRNGTEDIVVDESDVVPITLEEFSERVEELKQAELQETIIVFDTDNKIETESSDRLENMDAGDELVAELSAAKKAIEEDAKVLEELLGKKTEMDVFEEDRDSASEEEEKQKVIESVSEPVMIDDLSSDATDDSVIVITSSAPTEMMNVVTSLSNVTSGANDTIAITDGEEALAAPKTDSAPLTLEEFSERVLELKQLAEDELAETMAILQAEPGAYSLNEEDEEAKKNKATETKDAPDTNEESDQAASSEAKPEVVEAVEKKKAEKKEVGEELVAELEAAKDAIEEDAKAIEQLLERKKEVEKELEADIELLLGSDNGDGDPTTSIVDASAVAEVDEEEVQQEVNGEESMVESKA